MDMQRRIDELEDEISLIKTLARLDVIEDVSFIHDAGAAFKDNVNELEVRRKLRVEFHNEKLISYYMADDSLAVKFQYPCGFCITFYRAKPLKEIMKDIKKLSKSKCAIEEHYDTSVTKQIVCSVKDE